MSKGILYGIGAYALWGFFPIYWKLLHDVPAEQVIGHRIGWSFILLLAYILLASLVFLTRRGRPLGWPLVVASSLTALWAGSIVLSALLEQPQVKLMQLAEVARNELQFMGMMAQVSARFPQTVRTSGAYSVDFRTRPTDESDLLLRTDGQTEIVEDYVGSEGLPDLI